MSNVEENNLVGEPAVATYQPSRLASSAAVWIVCGFSVCLIFVGACVTGLVLKEPDICWLLAGGKWIVMHGHLPPTDPFSYTTHYMPGPYVIEKWLTEVIFYQVFAWTGAAGLLVFDSLLICITFVIMPMRLAFLYGWRGGRALLLAFVVCWTSMSHLCVRPENFSFLILGIFFEVLIRSMKRTQATARIDWRSIGLLILLTCLWSNLHTLFLVSPLLCGLYFGCSVVERFLPELKDKPFNWTPAIMFICCVPATLLNAYGTHLWEYMPYVFGKFNDTNNEMQPIKLSNALAGAFWPFYIMIFWSMKGLIQRGLRRPFEQGDLFFRALVLAGTIGGIKTIRTIPLSGLFFAAALSQLYKSKQSEVPAAVPAGASSQAASLQSSKSAEAAEAAESAESSELLDSPPRPGLFQAVSDKLTDLVNPMTLRFPVFCVVTMCLSTFLMTHVVEPEIPQGSKAFNVPGAAVEYIIKHPPHGNQLNDPHFGDVLIFRMDNNPPVFIDSRYNLFGNDILEDYWKMVRCQTGWQEALNKYDIQWVFLPTSLELPKRLASDSAWTRLYSDAVSVIYSRNPQDRGGLKELPAGQQSPDVQPSEKQSEIRPSEKQPS